MMIIGCDLHTRYQQIAMLDTETGELVERRLEHESGEARAFYAALSGGVRVGIEATGHTHWFEAMLAELGHELWMGDAAKIRASVVRKQKTDARDAEHLLNLLREDRFPQIWRPSPAERDLRQLLLTYTGLRISDVGLFRIDRLHGNEVFLRAKKNGGDVFTWIPDWLAQRLTQRAKRHGPRPFITGESDRLETVTDLWRRRINKVFELARSEERR